MTREQLQIQKIEKLMKEMPDYCTSLINSKMGRLGTATCLIYASDIHNFFVWLKSKLNYNGEIKDIPATQFESITEDDITEYLNYLSRYTGPDGVVRENNNTGKSRKLSALRSLCKYLNREGLAKNNPTEFVKNPKVELKKKKKIDNFGQEAILNAIDTGIDLSGRKMVGKRYTLNQRHKSRNLAILSLILDAKMPTMEISALNVDDLHLDEGYIAIQGKNGKTPIYVTRSTIDKLQTYTHDRERFYKPTETEKALFISKKNKRLSVRSIQYMVKTYTELAVGDNAGKLM